jgi:hypothetical protein
MFLKQVIRKNVNALRSADLNQLRALLDQYISKPSDNPVKEDRDASRDISLMTLGDGFLAWHQHYIAKLEHWLVINGGQKFVPLPYWDPAESIPSQLTNNNTEIYLPLPNNLEFKAIKIIRKYIVLNNRIIPYHKKVHENLGGHMPDPNTSALDPIFWPFHSFLLAIYEQWRSLK